jgi:hypothetical protein
MIWRGTKVPNYDLGDAGQHFFVASSMNFSVREITSQPEAKILFIIYQTSRYYFINFHHPRS